MPIISKYNTESLDIKTYPTNMKTKILTLLMVFAFSIAFTQSFRKAPYLLYTGNNTEMLIIWQLDIKAACTLEWGTDDTYSLGSIETEEYGDSHQHKIILTELNPNTKYYCKVSSFFSDTKTCSFITGATASDNKISFFAYGDTRSHPEKHNLVAERILEDIQQNPAAQTFIVSSGDLVSNGDSEEDWDDQFFDPQYSSIQQLLAQLPYMCAVGNHEGQGSLFAKYFPYPMFNSNRYYYSYDYGSAHIVIIDQFSSYSIGSTQYNWLVNDLASSDKPWKILLLHEMGWSAGHHANNKAVQDIIQPLCKTYGVQFVIGGHNHYYARAVVDGVTHITTGGGGANFYTPNPNAENIVKVEKTLHYCKLDIDNDTLIFSAKRDDGSIIESISIVNTYQNDILRLAPVGNYNITEDSTSNIPLLATGGSEKKVTFSTSELPSFAFLVDNEDGTANITLSPSGDDVGTYENITVTATNGETTDSAIFTIKVRALSNNMIAYWLKKSTGIGLFDFSGNNLHATLSSSNITYVDGKVEEALLFDGSFDGTVKAADMFKLPSVTIAAYIKVDASNTQGAWIAAHGDNYGLFINDEGFLVLYFFDNSGLNESNSYTSFKDDKWHHVAASFNDDSKEMKIYVDGKLETTFTRGGSFTYSNGSDFHIGSMNGNRNFKGIIDELKVFDYELSAREVKELLVKYTLTTNAENGTVIPSDSTYYDGTTAELTAIPNEGYKFSKWTGDISGLSNPVTVTMDTNKTITAIFIDVSGINNLEEKSVNLSCYPNPFSGTTTISYTLKRTSNVNITVFDEIGRTIIVLVNQNQTLGNYNIEFDGTNLESGVFYYQFISDEQRITNKMILNK